MISLASRREALLQVSYVLGCAEEFTL